MNNKPLIIANWKMNPSSQKEVKRLWDSIKEGIKKNKEAEIIVCPPFIWLSFFSGVLEKLGAQDCFWENKGAYTGEISSLMLKDLGCQYVIVGHSERRKYFGESDEIINRKLKAVLKNRMKPVFCVGEETRDSLNGNGKQINEMGLIVGEQLEKGLIGISTERIREIIFAYEPIWAIGTGQACLPDDAMKARLFIRKILSKLYSRETAEKARIVYGGSIDSKNVSDYVKNAKMDGILVGGASINASEFNKIVEKIG
ncbi:MAG: triose-phosphate isomerase [Parcubacteria group bacterium CG1_02_44_65]|uniref:Triosephosphate isomerase n=5 Tax=Candidatus Portnoyibacteriota TaxID=1817913 RepID=A0A2M8KHB6_9BACT|nr:MAG: triose-phosphate isomerase [Parcubacteria group bacterium CG1_02_44_65]PIP15771.1 MAG: triose-phosphate isomerase [Candidatus Portnoybacteria bacterium CG23_combo_of_CG06-09_8_20_14_all_44_36]PJE59306.1 MAG: triose-phosphate isomerase [Candidatus Portnoybacteria bacterium CG10_big_fil_rev_8_21_14_0_10_43_39]